MAASADIRAWLEDAISSAKAALPTNNEPATEQETQDHQRKLVTVRRISSETPINRTHKVVTIDGWKVVVKKTKDAGEGDLVVFLEANSFLPARCRFADYSHLFAEVGSLITFDGEEGYRVGTSTWKDYNDNIVFSQGHIFGLRDLPHIRQKVTELRWERCSTHTDDQFVEFLRDVDFSNALGVRKWESPADRLDSPQMMPVAFPKYPSFIRKPEMERVQNCPNLFIKPKYCTFLFQESVKMDGASMTVYFVRSDSPFYRLLPRLPRGANKGTTNNPLLKHAVHPEGRLGVCSRQIDLVPHLVDARSTPQQHAYWAAALAASLHTSLPKVNRSIAVQGELVGSGVQGNPYGHAPGRREFLVFAVYDIERGQRWDPREVEAFAARIGAPHVPVTGYYTIWSVARDHEDLITRAELKKAEGLVWKNCQDGRWFKILSSAWVMEKEKAEERKKKGQEGVEEAKPAVRGWQMSQEEIKILIEIIERRRTELRTGWHWDDVDLGVKGMVDGPRQKSLAGDGGRANGVAKTSQSDSTTTVCGKGPGTQNSREGTAASINKEEENTNEAKEAKDDAKEVKNANELAGLPESHNDLVNWLGIEGWGL